MCRETSSACIAAWVAAFAREQTVSVSIGRPVIGDGTLGYLDDGKVLHHVMLFEVSLPDYQPRLWIGAVALV